LLPKLGIHLGVGIVSAIVNATIGAVVATAYHKACARWHWLGSSMVIDEGLDQRTPLLH